MSELVGMSGNTIQLCCILSTFSVYESVNWFKTRKEEII